MSQDLREIGRDIQRLEWEWEIEALRKENAELRNEILWFQEQAKPHGGTLAVYSKIDQLQARVAELELSNKDALAKQDASRQSQLEDQVRRLTAERDKYRLFFDQSLKREDDYQQMLRDHAKWAPFSATSPSGDFLYDQLQAKLAAASELLSKVGEFLDNDIANLECSASVYTMDDDTYGTAMFYRDEIEACMPHMILSRAGTRP